MLKFVTSFIFIYLFIFKVYLFIYFGRAGSLLLWAGSSLIAASEATLLVAMHGLLKAVTSLETHRL